MKKYLPVDMPNYRQNVPTYIYFQFSIGAIVLVKQNNAVMFNVAKTLKQGQGRCRM